MSEKNTDRTGGWPAFDFSEWMKGMSPPEFDVGDLLESGRKDAEAYQKATQAAWDGWQTVARRQAEMFQQAVDHWQKNLTDALARPPQENMEQQAQVLRDGFERAMADMRELAEITSKSQTEVLSILSERFEENMTRLREAFEGAGSDKGAKK